MKLAPPPMVETPTWTWRAYLRNYGLAWTTPFAGIFVFALNALNINSHEWRIILLIWCVLYVGHTWMLTHFSMWWRVFAHNLITTGVTLANAAYTAGLEEGRTEDKPWLRANLEEEDA